MQPKRFTIIVNVAGHFQSEIAAMIFSSQRQTRQSFAMGRLKVPLAVLLTLVKQYFDCREKTWQTRPICQWFLECPSPAIRTTLLLSDKLMRCCAAGRNGCLNLKRHASALYGRVSAKWSRCPGSMAWHARHTVAPLLWNSARCMPARIGRMSTGVGCRQPVTICKTLLVAGSIRWVWALRHQTAAQYSVVECTRARLAVHRVVAPAPNWKPRSRLRSMTCDVSFLQSDSNCWWYVNDLSNVTPQYLGLEQEGRVQLMFSLLVKMEGCRHRFCSAEL